LQDKLDEVSNELDATAKLTIQTSLDFADHRAALQCVVFLTGAAKQKCLEIQEGYCRGWAEVLAGTKRKVFLLRYSV